MDKILLYAPPTESARALMQSILHEVEQQADSLLHDGAQQLPWTLEPVVQMVEDDSPSVRKDGHNNNNNTHGAGTCLTAILQHALAMARQRQERLWRQYVSSISSSSAGDPAQNCHRGRVVFLGMDCPELPLQELVALTRVPVPNQHTGESSSSSTTTTTTALLCPAADGGYGLLAVPVNAPDTIFDGVLWSHSLTAVSQLKALTDAGMTKNNGVVLGPLMHDIDTPDDVDALRNRLLLRKQHQHLQQLIPNEDGSGDDPTNVDRNNTTGSETANCLMCPSALAMATDGEYLMTAVSCRHTWQALQDIEKYDP